MQAANNRTECSRKRKQASSVHIFFSFHLFVPLSAVLRSITFLSEPSFLCPCYLLSLSLCKKAFFESISASVPSRSLAQEVPKGDFLHRWSLLLLHSPTIVARSLCPLQAARQTRQVKATRRASISSRRENFWMQTRARTSKSATMHQGCPTSLLRGWAS